MKRISESAGQTDDERIGPRNVFARLPALRPTVLKKHCLGFRWESGWFPTSAQHRANPTEHFWFTKISAGRYYVLSLIEEGSGPHKEEQAAGLA
jgi:hypothetical protein